MTQHEIAIAELGRRLSDRRAEACLELDALAERAGVAREAIERFESGAMSLGAGALTRIAAVLGIPAAGLLSVEAPEERAPTAPEMLLLGKSTGWLRPRDTERIARAFDRARAFVELGDLLRVERVGLPAVSTLASELDPYREGYSSARIARHDLDLPSEALRNLSRIIEDRFDILVVRFRFESPDVRAAAARAGRIRIIALNTVLRRLGSIRRALAHELAHHLLDLPVDGAVVDRAQEGEAYSHEKAAVEKRADAFALMFLAPEAGVRALLGHPRQTANLETARSLTLELRRTFGLGFDAAAYHLENLGYFAHKGMAEALQDDASPVPELEGFEVNALPDGLERRLRAAEEASLLSSGRRRELLGRAWVDES